MGLYDDEGSAARSRGSGRGSSSGYGLYDGIMEDDAQVKKGGGMSSRPLFAPASLQRKRPHPSSAKPTARAAETSSAVRSPAPSSSANSTPQRPLWSLGHEDSGPGVLDVNGPEDAPVVRTIGYEEEEDEYDPLRPSDYEVFVAEREEYFERERLREEQEREREEREREERLRASTAPSPAPATPAPTEDSRAHLKLSGEEAYLRRLQMSQGGPAAAPGHGLAAGKRDVNPTPSDQANREESTDAGGSFGARLLAKMGWKEGAGLGKLQQGITAPLQHMKTSRSAGVIVAPESAQSEMTKGSQIHGTPSRVLLLLNMVGPGEVDDELNEETKVECEKYGVVESVLIFEVTDGSVPAEEAVRIFVKFQRNAEAMKAAVVFNGRFFGGRQIRAEFFDEQRFDNVDLAPQ